MAIELAPAPTPATERPAEATPVRVRIEVTATDIAAGKRGMGQFCPVALAMLRAFAVPRRDISLLLDRVTIIQPWPSVSSFQATLPSGHIVPLPAAATDFVRRFDAGAQVQPLTFVWEIPVEAAS